MAYLIGPKNVECTPIANRATNISGIATLSTAIPRAGVATVKAWLSGDKVPGKDQINALARTFGVPAGALLS